MNQDEIVAVTQRDREAAAACLDGEWADPKGAARIRAGQWDFHHLVTSHARHRIAAERETVEACAQIAQCHQTNGKREFGVKSRYDDAAEEIASAIRALTSEQPGNA